MQIDGSRHDWLEGRGPYLSLIGAVDDATGKVMHALFRDQEDAQGYFLLLRQIVGSYGIPLALYHDGHGIFERSRVGVESVEEQLGGRREPTQFGRLMEELGITSILLFFRALLKREEKSSGYGEPSRIDWLVSFAWQG